MRFEEYQSITFARRGRVLTATLNVPEQLNAIAGRLHTELANLFPAVAADPDCDVLVLTGAGRAFSAGGDLNYIDKVRQDPPLFAESVREAKRIVFGALDCDKPIICKMNGDAVGLGATVALFTDVIFAADTARIGDPHVKIGLVAGDGGAIIWPQLIGYARAKHYLLTGELIPAPEAAAMGLINFSLPVAELDAAVDAYADRLANGATKAIRWSKVTMNIGLKQLAHAMMDAGMAYEGMAAATADHGEAIRAMLERRKPVFTGN
jgi:enoyl-CoA hydratase